MRLSSSFQALGLGADSQWSPLQPPNLRTRTFGPLFQDVSLEAGVSDWPSALDFSQPGADRHWSMGGRLSTNITVCGGAGELFVPCRSVSFFSWLRFELFLLNRRCCMILLPQAASSAAMACLAVPPTWSVPGTIYHSTPA